MTAADIVAEVKRLLPSDADEDLLLCRIEELSRVIKAEITDTHESPPASFDMGEAKDAFVNYLLMKNDADLSDTDGYLVHAALFRDAYGDFADRYNRAHMPKGEKIRL